MATWFKPVNRFSCEEKGEKARKGGKQSGRSTTFIIALPPTFSVRFFRLTASKRALHRLLYLGHLPLYPGWLLW